jgi:hypothetical protein
LSSGDCAGDRPVCDTGNDICVECLSNSDCPADAPYCASDQTCVQCPAGYVPCDGQCIADTLCCPSGGGAPCGQGATCTSIGVCTCPSGSHISPVTGNCIADGTCPNYSNRECANPDQVCCGPETDKPGKCVGKGKDGGNRACYLKTNH